MGGKSAKAMPGSRTRLGPSHCTGEQRAENKHAGLHRVGGQQHFRHEQDPVAEIDADDAHAFDETVVQDALGRPAARQKNARRFLDLAFQTVVQVIVDLLGQFFVVERGQVKVVSARLGHRHTPALFS